MITGIFARLRSLWRGLRHRGDVEAEMREEFLHHVELRTEDLVREGLPPQEAARQARLEFGHIEGHREDARAARGLRMFDQTHFSWLDIKLGVRMLAKYPGLSVVSVIGMSVAIAIGAGGFGLIHSFVDAPLPLDEGERIVSLLNADAANPNNQDEQTTQDFLQWRDQLTSVRDLGAFTTARARLVIPGGSVDHVQIAHVTASGFRVARVAPILGRPLLDDDERPGAPPVLVIAHEEWQRRFDEDPGIIGRPVRIDYDEDLALGRSHGEVHTVVGVMPEGFRFPVNHRYWVPLRFDPSAHEIGGGPSLTIFGRLADDATVEQAQAEIATIGRRMAVTHPETHEHLRPWVMPYIRGAIDVYIPSLAWLIRTFQLGLSSLLLVVSVNVAVLVYARTAARTGEIAVRTALGASRRRVVTQLFAEAFVLSALAAAVGLTTAVIGFDTFKELVTQGNAVELPFWFDLGLSPVLIAYTAGLAVLAAAIVGVFPALRATGRAVHGGLQQISSRASPMQLGRVWTALIIVQVAVAVAVLPYTIYYGAPALRGAVAESDYPIEEFLRASLSGEMERAPANAELSASEAAHTNRFAASVSEIVRRLEAEPEVAAVTFANRYPANEGDRRSLEIDGDSIRNGGLLNEVDIRLFTVLDVPILAGRGFKASDAARGSNAVIVNSVFAEAFLRGPSAPHGPSALLLDVRSLLGRRVRWAPIQDGSGESDPGPWLEIVGIVPEFVAGSPPPFGGPTSKLYRPLALADAARSIQLAIRMRPDTPPATFIRRAREIALSVDPTLRFGLQTAAESERLQRKGLFALALMIVGVTGSVLLLSAAGIYAMMSFTVASRRREIGIRIALGASSRRVLSGIFRRVMMQLGAGVLVGLVLAVPMPRVEGGALFAGEGLLMLPVIAAIILAVGLFAALGPARRGVAVEPTEALREE